MNPLELEVLKVNANWVPIGVISVRQALKDAAGGAGGLCKHEHGWFTIISLDQWMELPVAKNEPAVHHGHYMYPKRIKIPRVMMSVNYKEFHAKEIKCTIDNLLKRYGHKDAVTGEPLRREDASREHVRPRSKGGKDGWGNEVPMHKRTNSKRGNKSYRKVGLKKPKILPPPRPMLPVNALVNKHGYPEWAVFGIRGVAES